MSVINMDLFIQMIIKDFDHYFDSSVSPKKTAKITLLNSYQRPRCLNAITKDKRKRNPKAQVEE